MPTLAAWLHNLDPFAVRLWPDGPAALQGIRWYGLSYLIGFAAAFFFARRVARNIQSPLQPTHAWDLIVAVALGVLIGGRLGYVLFYQPALLWDPPLIGIFQVWRGGMASHGGMIGALIGCACFARRRGLPVLHITDIMAAAAPVGLFFGRVANFINGELYGRGPTDVPWAVRFPHEIAEFTAAQWERIDAALATLPMTVQRQARFDPVGTVIEQMREGNAQLIAVIEPMLTPRHPSQIYQALLEGLLLLAILLWVWRRPRKPGIVSGLFLSVYGILRVVVEHFREPDAHLGYQALGLTRGQWLSFALIAAGLAMTILCARRNVQPLPGWPLHHRASPSHQPQTPDPRP
jgi:phosphatidylglycerol---prolipoprotein diacylglyceryl transferase